MIILGIDPGTGRTGFGYIEIQKDKDGNLLFKTQGDNNNVPDSNMVYADQIIGCVKLYIPYIGYPSVWFSEKILGVKSFITV